MNGAWGGKNPQEILEENQTYPFIGLNNGTDS